MPWRFRRPVIQSCACAVTRVPMRSAPAQMVFMKPSPKAIGGRLAGQLQWRSDLHHVMPAEPGCAFVAYGHCTPSSRMFLSVIGGLDGGLIFIGWGLSPR